MRTSFPVAFAAVCVLIGSGTAGAQDADVQIQIDANDAATDALLDMQTEIQSDTQARASCYDLQGRLRTDIARCRGLPQQQGQQNQ